MGRQGKKTPGPDGLGRALQRKQVQTATQKRAASRGVGDAAYGTEARGKMVSVLEATSLDDFIANVMLEEAAYASNMEAPVVLGPAGEADFDFGDEQGDEGGWDNEAQSHHEHLTLPRRPAWTESMSAEELDQLEQRTFLTWRRAIADMEEGEHRRKVTPFEKNLEVWRQLWRVMERSDLVVQIVDARNPFFYYSSDLEAYGASLKPPKPMVVLVNKGDLLTGLQRQAWAAHYAQEGKQVLFFSAVAAMNKLIDEARHQRDGYSSDEDAGIAARQDADIDDPSSALLSREQLLAELQRLAAKAVDPAAPVRNQGRLCVGMVGYPNVGKSSVINVLVGATHLTHGIARVSVGSTPGKTKHFQTIVISDELMLCDCPGLVFPSFVSSSAEMLCMGVLPLMNLRDPLPATEIIARRIPRPILELAYTITLKDADLGGLGPRETPGTLLLRTICETRGYVRAQALGEPDLGQAARLLIKDYTSGKLTFCHPPPDLEAADRDAFLLDTEVTQLGQARMSQKLKEKAKKLGLEEEPLAATPGIGDTEIVQERLRQRQDEILRAQAERPNGPTRAEQGRKTWAKKGKKLRNPVPYEDGTWAPGQIAQVQQQRKGKKGSRNLEKHEEKRQERLAAVSKDDQFDDL
jgi:large subunit GTPase 1